MSARRVTAALAASVVLLLAAPAAHAATGSPPVTSADHVSLRAGEAIPVDVTANDKDPDGDQLAVCRLGPLPRALNHSQVIDGELVVFASSRAKGTFELTYYACDDSYLSAGTLTVTVRGALPTFDIRPVGDAPPGRIRLVNTYKNTTFHCSWHSLTSPKVLGRATVRPMSTTVVTVRLAEVAIDCSSPRNGYSAVFGASDPVS